MIQEWKKVNLKGGCSIVARASSEFASSSCGLGVVRICTVSNYSAFCAEGKMAKVALFIEHISACSRQTYAFGILSHSGVSLEPM